MLDPKKAKKGGCVGIPEQPKSEAMAFSNSLKVTFGNYFLAGQG
jgi:hypothetical protein